jgi:hypothetical protein
MPTSDERDRVAPFIREYGELSKKGFPAEQTVAYKAKVAELPQSDQALIASVQATLDRVEERIKNEDLSSTAECSAHIPLSVSL